MERTQKGTTVSSPEEQFRAKTITSYQAIQISTNRNKDRLYALFISKPIFLGTWGAPSGAKKLVLILVFNTHKKKNCPAIHLIVFIGVQRGKIWTAELCWLLIRKLRKNLTQPPFLNASNHVIRKQRSKKKTVGVVIISSNFAQYSQLQRVFLSLSILLHKHITSTQFNYKWCGRFNQMLSKCVNLTCLSQTKCQELFNVSIRGGNFLLDQYELIKKKRNKREQEGELKLKLIWNLMLFSVILWFNSHECRATFSDGISLTGRD